jgi:hypothetical protein
MILMVGWMVVGCCVASVLMMLMNGRDYGPLSSRVGTTNNIVRVDRWTVGFGFITPGRV